MNSHPCPAPGCPLTVPTSKLACKTHWFMIPRDLRNRVWDAWAGGLGAGSPAHHAAISDALEALKAKIESDSE